MEKKNYDKMMESIVKEHQMKKEVPTLLLHTCCAPCSTEVLERLSEHFKITVFYYNPNIEPYLEYQKRKDEQIRLLKCFPSKNKISFLDCDYEGERYQEVTKGLENELEGGKRCTECFFLRLEKTALVAKKNNFDYFGTSLTVSPYKNANLLNEIGSKLESIYNINFLYSDFKKQNGYKRSIELSHEYQLYRQDYCGCHFSKQEREEYKKRRANL